MLSCLKSICFICSNLIPPEVINKIFDIASIEEVVGEYVTLKRAGANFKGLCPFHDDKSPSMSVSPSKGIFKCFSCGEVKNNTDYEISLIFSNNAHIALTTETIEVRLEDQNEIKV
mgnify:CR=1 FL=1